MLENTKYANNKLGTLGQWLETPYESSATVIWSLGSTTRTMNTGVAASRIDTRGVRPVIEVLKSDISFD